MTDLGTIEKAGDRHVLRYERRFAHPIERVWAALTDPDGLRAWLAAAEVDLKVGGTIVLRWLNVPEDPKEWEGKVQMPEDHDVSAPVRCTITELDPPHVIEYENDEMGLMRWELRAEGDACALTFTNTIELPEGQPPEQTLAGWHIHLDHLVEALAGQPADWDNWTEKYMGRWSEIRDRYTSAPS